MSEIKPIPSEIGKRYLAARTSADAFLARQKLVRLRAMTNDEAREIKHAILAFPLPTDMPERVCRLVEQQQRFRKLSQRK